MKRSLCLLLVTSAFLGGCTKQQAVAAKPVIEQGVDVAVAACSGIDPTFAWICAMSDAAIDALLDHFLPPGALAVPLSKVSRASKNRAVVDILKMIDAAKAGALEPTPSRSL